MFPHTKKQKTDPKGSPLKKKQHNWDFSAKKLGDFVRKAPWEARVDHPTRHRSVSCRKFPAGSDRTISQPLQEVSMFFGEVFQTSKKCVQNTDEPTKHMKLTTYLWNFWDMPLPGFQQFQKTNQKMDQHLRHNLPPSWLLSTASGCSSGPGGDGMLWSQIILWSGVVYDSSLKPYIHNIYFP